MVILDDASSRPRGYGAALLLVAAATLLGRVVDPRWGDAAVDLLFIPAVLAAAVLGGRGPALMAALASVLAYNFYFTEPRFSFLIDSPGDVATVIVLFAVALVTSQLAASVRQQAQLAEAHANRNETIAGLARQLLGCTSEKEVLDTSVRELAVVFRCNAVFVSKEGRGQPVASAPDAIELTPGDVATATLVLESGGRAGRGLDRALPVEWQFHAVQSATGTVGAMGLARDDGAPSVAPDQFALLDSLLDQVALALERARLGREAVEFARTRERDRVKSTLLASVGEDLRPALSAITAASRRVRRNGPVDKEGLAAIEQEAGKLDRYLVNLVDLGLEDDVEAVEAGDVTIDLVQRTVSRSGKAVHLTPKEFGVLAELAKHPNRVLPHGHLLRSVWGPAQEGQPEYLRVAVRGLRQKLERDPTNPRLILNEPAVGYRLQTSTP